MKNREKLMKEILQLLEEAEDRVLVFVYFILIR